MNMRAQQAQTQIRNISNDIPGALKYLENAQANRDSVYKYGTPASTEQQQQVSGAVNDWVKSLN